MRTVKTLALVATLAVAGCAGSSIATFTADVAASCGNVMKTAGTVTASLKGGALNTANGYIGTYATPACATSAGIAVLANDPTSIEWLDKVNADIKSIGVSAAPAPGPAPATPVPGAQ